MFTRNFYNIGMTDKSSSSGGCYFRNYRGDYVRVNSKGSGDANKSVGVQMNPENTMYDYNSSGLQKTYGFCDIVFGSGTNEESLEDCTLQYISPSGFSSVSIGYDVTENGEDFVISRYKIIKYTGSDPVTITEIGLMGGVGNGSSNYYKPMLVYRKLLDEPIIITPGMTFTLTIDVGTPVEE